MVGNLKTLRIAKGLSQQKLADSIGVTQQAINQYENGKVEPDIDNLIRLSDALEVSVDLLIGHEVLDPTTDNLVSDDEFELIESFRSLGASDKKMLTRMMDLMVNNSD